MSDIINYSEFCDLVKKKQEDLTQEECEKINLYRYHISTLKCKSKTLKKRDGKSQSLDLHKTRDSLIKADWTARRYGSTSRISKQDINFLLGKVIYAIHDKTISSTVELGSFLIEALHRYEFTDIANVYAQFRNDFSTIVRNVKKSLFHHQDTATGYIFREGLDASDYFADKYLFKPLDLVNEDQALTTILDKAYYGIGVANVQPDLIKLFEKDTFMTSHGLMNKPISIEEYTDAIILAIQELKNDVYSEQGIPNIDYILAIAVNNTFKEEYCNIYTTYASISDSFKSDFVKISIESVLNELFDHLKFTYSFHDIDKSDLDKFISSESYLEDIRKVHNYTLPRALENTVKRTVKSIKRFIMNLSTNGLSKFPIPKVTLGYGLDTTDEGRLVSKTILDITSKGVILDYYNYIANQELYKRELKDYNKKLLQYKEDPANHEEPEKPYLSDSETAFIYPIHSFMIKSGVNLNPQDVNYDLYKLAIRVSYIQKYPQFIFLDSSFNKHFYKPNVYNSYAFYTKNHTRVIDNFYSKENQTTLDRGNVSTTVINLFNLIKYYKSLEANYTEPDQDYSRLYSVIDSTVFTVVEQLENSLQASKSAYKNFLTQNNLILQSDVKDSESNIIPFHNFSLTVGIVALAEALTELTGSNHGESDSSQILGLQLISHISNLLKDVSTQKEINFLLAGIDDIDAIKLISERDNRTFGNYYTPSFMIPLSTKLCIFKRIFLESRYHQLTNGGHYCNIKLDGYLSMVDNIQEKVLAYMKRCNVGCGNIYLSNDPLDTECEYTCLNDGICKFCSELSLYTKVLI